MSKLLRMILLLVALAFMASAACSSSDNESETSRDQEAAPSLMDEVWGTSAIDDDLTTRKAVFAKIQTAADACSASTFSSYLSGGSTLGTSLEKSVPIIGCYNEAFDKVLREVKEVQPAQGEVVLWMLYNMGYVVKTFDGAFAIDIFHRRSAELAPYIDFYAMTHIHNDHKSIPLAEAMVAAGKPVLSSFFNGGSKNRPYLSETDADYTLGAFYVHSFITNHNNSAMDNVPVTVFKVDCGDGANHCILIHSGDSNFRPEQFESVQGNIVDIYIPRYAPNALTENQIIGTIINPSFCLLSHILELTHKDPSSSRWTLEQGLERASKLNCSHSYMPFWGEKLVWKNKQIYKY